MVRVDVILSPLGCRIVIWTSVVVKLLAGALVVSSEMEAAVLIKGVVSSCVGLAQPDSRLIELANFWLTTATEMVFTGMHYQGVG